VKCSWRCRWLDLFCLEHHGSQCVDEHNGTTIREEKGAANTMCVTSWSHLLRLCLQGSLSSGLASSQTARRTLYDHILLHRERSNTVHSLGRSGELGARHARERAGVTRSVPRGTKSLSTFPLERARPDQKTRPFMHWSEAD
jgi:hypothetical protein